MRGVVLRSPFTMKANIATATCLGDKHVVEVTLKLDPAAGAVGPGRRVA